MLKILAFLTVFFAQEVLAQQNFFNIPSGQMTPESKFFYQHQFNIYSSQKISSKQHLVYGLPNDFEAGINFLNYDVFGNAEKQENAPSSNILAMSFQKSFGLSRNLSMNLGTQLGFSHLGTPLPLYPTSKTYGLASYYNADSHLRLTGGGWISGARFNGPGDFYGALLGFEWMFAKGIYLMGDWISGDTANSTSVIGGMVDVSKTIQLCLGYLIPNPSSPENHALVMEVNIYNF
jgi:hypothetical protein